MKMRCFFVLTNIAKLTTINHMKANEPEIVEGIFFNTRVLVTQQKLIRIFNDKNIPFYDFKPVCDKIGVYLIREGFVTTKTPRIEVKNP